MGQATELSAPLTQTPLPVRRATAQWAAPTAVLFLISVVGLFLELLLIRWVTTEIRIFAYLQNTVLVVCFLGLGMGCWDSRKPFVLRQILLPLLILVGLLAIPTTRLALGQISDMLSGISGMTIWGSDGVTSASWQTVVAPLIGIALTFGLMVLLWDIFVPVGRLLGRLIDDHPNTITAYSVNVAGSLIGIWLFVALSGFGLPPVAWFAVFALGAVFLIGSGGKSKFVDVALLCGIVGLGALAGYEPGWKETVWSPYQKLSVIELNKPRETSVWDNLRGTRVPGSWDIGTHFIAVNNTGYQATIDLRPDRPAGNPLIYPPQQRGYSQYDLPALFHPAPYKVLIVGAGSGNDAAGALRNGAQDVVAVDIDPAIIDFGRRFHPEQPYSDPRVRVVNDDARSYFATCTEKFDVIAFGLLDSHTTTAMTNARLDHYVYTRESLAHAKTLLNPGGIVVLSFEAQKPFIADRMAQGLKEVFGYEPLMFKVPFNGYGWGGVFFVTGNLDAVHNQIATRPQLAALIKQWTTEVPPLPGTTEVPSDDWPYLYLESRHIPVLYFVLAIALGLLFVRGVHTLGMQQTIRGWDRSQSHFALLGAAFMLLEVQNISKAAVVLGNTWVVNAVIISGILCMILLANGLAGRLRNFAVGPVYAALVATCIGLYFLDLSRFGFLPYPLKATIVGALTSLPMLFSGLVFIRSFAAAERKDAALGANLMGALAGGLLQSVTFVTGIKALLLIVAALYIGAMLTRPRTEPTAGNEPAVI
jgi:ubiquinone/menaquinone biosynthesis C-methylase UbiE